MSLDKALKNLKFDKRLTEYNLNKGHLSKEELNKHLSELPDVGSKIDLVSLARDERSQSETH